MRRRIAVFGAVVFGSLAATAVVAIPAEAHTVTIQSSVDCDQVSGTFTITYTGSTSNVPASATGTATVSGALPSASSATVTRQPTGPGPSSFSLVQRDVPGTATTASITVAFAWSDQATASKTYSVPLSYPCISTTHATPTAPTFSDDHCWSHSPSGAQYTVPAVDGVDYYVNGTRTAAGTYAATDGSTVTVTAQPKYGFVLSGDTTWTHQFPAVPTCTETVTPATPTFVDDTCVNHAATGAGYTIPTSEGVDYYVDGVKTAAGTYPATDGTSVTISGQAQPGYVIVGDDHVSHTFTWTPTCTESVTPAVPTFTDDTCVDHAAVGASYTIPTSEGVDYYVDGVKTAAGTYPATDGTSVTISGRAQPGYVISGDDHVSHSYTWTPTCTETVIPTAPTFTDAGCAGYSPTTAGYTIPSVTGVDWFVDGVPSAAGTFPAGGGTTVTVIATPQPGYVIDGDATWTHTFPAAPTCTTPATTTAPTFTPATCVDGVLHPATVTIPATDGVDYSVDGTPVPAGTYPVHAGDPVTVVATPQPGRTLVGDTTWAWTAPDATACLPPVVTPPGNPTPPTTPSTPGTPVSPVRTPPVVIPPLVTLPSRHVVAPTAVSRSVTPAALAYTGTALPATDTALIAGLLIVLGGTLCGLATRRRTD